MELVLVGGLGACAMEYVWGVKDIAREFDLTFKHIEYGDYEDYGYEGERPIIILNGKKLRGVIPLIKVKRFVENNI